MKHKILISLSLLLLSQTAAGQKALFKAATRYVPGVRWRAESVVVADFTCNGRKQQAILGTNPAEIVIAVFINGTAHRPEVLRYSAEARNPVRTNLKAEDLDYGPEAEVGYELPGFQRSKIV